VQRHVVRVLAQPADDSQQRRAVVRAAAGGGDLGVVLAPAPRGAGASSCFGPTE